MKEKICSNLVVILMDILCERYSCYVLFVLLFQEDEIDPLKIDFVSFSQNSCKKDLLNDYIIKLILSGKEPRIVDVSGFLIAICS